MDSSHHALSSNTFYFILLCLLWYSSSAITNNIGKQILNSYPHPLTLTWIQFGFATLFSYVYSLISQRMASSSSSSIKKVIAISRLEPLSWSVIQLTAPLSCFQIVGHLFSSIAMTFIAVSFAHTIKALAPLFTVFIYRFVWQVMYSRHIYISLIPLTLGVMCVCSSKVSFHAIGFSSAILSTLIFVLQNIFSKKLFMNARHADTLMNDKKHLDKLNLLFFSSLLSFMFMLPLWFYVEGLLLLTDSTHIPSLSVVVLFVLNGISHFFQNMLAFTLLSAVSPVTYSIASLVKRIFVITSSIIWFGDYLTWIQACGIVLTSIGLYLYDKAKLHVAKSEAALDLATPLLPTTQTLVHSTLATRSPRSRTTPYTPQSHPPATVLFHQDNVPSLAYTKKYDSKLMDTLPVRENNSKARSRTASGAVKSD